jgi:hypothetical protein
MALSERDLVGVIFTPILIIGVCVAVYVCCYRAHAGQIFVLRRRMNNDVEMGNDAPPTENNYVV